MKRNKNIVGQTTKLNPFWHVESSNGFYDMKNIIYESKKESEYLGVLLFKSFCSLVHLEIYFSQYHLVFFHHIYDIGNSVGHIIARTYSVD